MNSVRPRVLVIHGPNLNLLGRRETNVYGTMSLEDIDALLEKKALVLGLDLEIVQTNHEGEMVEAIQKTFNGYAGIVINPAAFSHYSIAVRDAIAAVPVPAIEVHLSNIYSREEFRHHSVVTAVAKGQISGLGPLGYLFALEAIADSCGGGKQ